MQVARSLGFSVMVLAASLCCPAHAQGNSEARPAQDAPALVPTKLDDRVAEGLLVKKIEPQYPEEARKAGICGRVKLQAIIGTNGALKNIQVVEGHPLLTDAAMNAVRKWRYRPYQLDGKPVEFETAIIFNFNLPLNLPFDPAYKPFTSPALLTCAEVASRKCPQEDLVADFEDLKMSGAKRAPYVIYDPSPQYSKKAREAGLQGTVVLFLVVDSDGCPRNVRVTRPLGKGLDEEAIKAVRSWRFKPATKIDGTPVPVMVNVEVSFFLSR